MEAQKVTGHKTLAMLLRYTQMDVGHLVERLDTTEAHARLPGRAAFDMAGNPYGEDFHSHMRPSRTYLE